MANNNSGKNEKDLVCSFCGKHQDEVERMIIGPGNFSFLLGQDDYEQFAIPCVEAEKAFSISPTMCAMSRADARGNDHTNGKHDANPG